MIITITSEIKRININIYLLKHNLGKEQLSLLLCLLETLVFVIAKPRADMFSMFCRNTVKSV